jgi:LPS sulfotransferase NodH
MLFLNKKNFVIFTHYRTGSRSLVEMLRAQKIPTFDEPFNPRHCFNSHDQMDLTYLNLLKKKNASIVFDQIFQKYLSFKHIFLQLNEKDNVELIQNYPVIYLTRKNIPEAALSFLVAQKTKIWHATKRSENCEVYKNNKELDLKEIYSKIGKINIKKLEIEIKNFEKIKTYQPKLKNFIPVYYEELYSGNWKKVCQNIFDFTETKNVNWEAVEEIVNSANKLNSEELYSAISNYEEISDFMKKLK